MGKIVCVGEILVEIMAADIGRDMGTPGQWLGPYPSGAPAILANQAARCGADVSMVGTVGDDAFGRACLDQLAASGVDISYCQVDARRATGVAFVSYSSDGSRSFLFHLAEAASGALPAESAKGLLHDAVCLHIEGSSFFSDEAARALLSVALVAKQLDVPISLDPNVRPEALTPTARRQLASLLTEASIVLASEGELASLLDAVSDVAAARRLLADHASIVIIKSGSRGSLVLEADREPVAIPALPIEEVDPTGAGDCYGGTFLARVFAAGDSAVNAARYASVAGALGVARRGPMEGSSTLSQIRCAAAAAAFSLSISQEA